MEMLGAGELRIEFAHGSTLSRKITRRPYQDVRRLTSRSVDVSKTGDLQEDKMVGLLELKNGPLVWTKAYEELVPTTFADQKGRFTHVVVRQTSDTRDVSWSIPTSRALRVLNLVHNGVSVLLLTLVKVWLVRRSNVQ